MRMTSAMRIYRTIVAGNYGSDVNYIANVILTSQTKPTTKLRNLKLKLDNGHEVRTGNTFDTIRINGNQVSYKALDLRD